VLGSAGLPRSSGGAAVVRDEALGGAKGSRSTALPSAMAADNRTSQAAPLVAGGVLKSRACGLGCADWAGHHPPPPSTI
jgi:hypothetical protein